MHDHEGFTAAPATSSFPVPLSPSTSTLAHAPATRTMNL
jgi:hypothetical protein